jgi:hypothetical protein
MTLAYEQKREDVVAAVSMMSQRLKWTFLGCFLFVVLVAIPNVWRATSSGSAHDVVVAVFPSAILIFLLLFLLWLQPRLAARKIILRAVEWRITDEAVHIQSEVASSEMHWNAYVKYREGKRVFLLYVQKGQAQFIPKRVLSEAQTEELRNLIAAHVRKA